MSHEVNQEKVAQKLAFQLANSLYRATQLEQAVEQLETKVATLEQQLNEANSRVEAPRE